MRSLALLAILVLALAACSRDASPTPTTAPGAVADIRPAVANGVASANPRTHARSESHQDSSSRGDHKRPPAPPHLPFRRAP